MTHITPHKPTNIPACVHFPVLSAVESEPDVLHQLLELLDATAAGLTLKQQDNRVSFEKQKTFSGFLVSLQGFGC